MEVLLDSTNFIEERGKKTILIWGWKGGVREESFSIIKLLSPLYPAYACAHTTFF